MILDVIVERDVVEQAREMPKGLGILGGIQAEIDRRCTFLEGRRGGILVSRREPLEAEDVIEVVTVLLLLLLLQI